MRTHSSGVFPELGNLEMNYVNKNMEVDVFGPAYGKTGWATHASSFAREMNKLVPVSYRAGIGHSGLLNKDFIMLWRGIHNTPRQFGIVVTGTPSVDQLSARWIVWETTVLSASIKQQCTTTDYLWTPSSWGYKNLVANGIEPKRITVVPEGVDTEFFRPCLEEKSNRFRFLFVGKWETRKCVDQLVKAFADEFSGKENVELVLHAHNGYIPGFSQKAKLESLNVSNDTNIILSDMKNKRQLRSLYQSANCFVMPTRAEGWGLPILESMACGVPAIVTKYSAPLDFVTNDNGYLLNVRQMIDAKCDQFNISTGQWADPDMSHLMYLMRHAYENPKELREKGINATETARQFSWQNSAIVAYDTIKSYLQFT